MNDSSRIDPSPVFPGPAPEWAAWQHIGVRLGFEVAWFEPRRIHGSTTLVEDGIAHSVTYEISLDDDWTTRGLRVETVSAQGRQVTELARIGDSWIRDGVPLHSIADCVDVDLEASVVTNSLPIRRHPGSTSAFTVPAAFVRLDGSVERLEQRYEPQAGMAFRYEAPAFGYRDVLTYATDGLVADYPGLARRIPRAT